MPNRNLYVLWQYGKINRTESILPKEQAISWNKKDKFAITEQKESLDLMFPSHVLKVCDPLANAWQLAFL